MSNYGMNTYKKAVASYGSPREIEAQALTLGANKLLQCRDNWEIENRQGLLREALRFNQKLWSIFQADLAGQDNPLSAEMKVRLLSISAYVDRQLFTIMADPSPEKLTPVIDINLSLAAGLRNNPHAVTQDNDEEPPF